MSASASGASCVLNYPFGSGAHGDGVSGNF
jgi:hypothetical protein